MVAIKDIFPPALLGTPGDLPKQFLPCRSETSSSPFLWGIVLFLHSRVGRLQGKALPLKETGFILLLDTLFPCILLDTLFPCIMEESGQDLGDC